jgi:hypothetical protein
MTFRSTWTCKKKTDNFFFTNRFVGRVVHSDAVICNIRNRIRTIIKCSYYSLSTY